MSLGLDTPPVYTDFQGLANLRRDALHPSPEVLRKVAQQFEALFVQEMLKNVRSSGFGNGLFDSDQMRLYREMFDQQLAVGLSANGGLGLADLLVKQLGAHLPSAAAADPSSDPAMGVKSAPAAPAGKVDAARAAAFGSPEEFVRALGPLARATARDLGIPPQVLLAQAALETGWGSRIMPRADGGSSHNLFGIKADAQWAGERVQSTTLEYQDGIAVKRSAAFRAYPSFADSFADYARFLRAHPRYSAALAATDGAAFTRALQAAGYATDPSYAEKINTLAGGEVLAGLDGSLKNDAAGPLL